MPRFWTAICCPGHGPGLGLTLSGAPGAAGRCSQSRQDHWAACRAPLSTRRPPRECGALTLAPCAQGDSFQAVIAQQVREKQDRAKRKRDMLARCRCAPRAAARPGPGGRAGSAGTSRELCAAPAATQAEQGSVRPFGEAVRRAGGRCAYSSPC